MSEYLKQIQLRTPLPRNIPRTLEDIDVLSHSITVGGVQSDPLVRITGKQRIGKVLPDPTPYFQIEKEYWPSPLRSHVALPEQYEDDESEDFAVKLEKAVVALRNSISTAPRAEHKADELISARTLKLIFDSQRSADDCKFKVPDDVQEERSRDAIERIISAFAERGFGAIESGVSSVRLAAFDASGQLVSADDDLLRTLVHDLSLALLRSAAVLNAILFDAYRYTKHHNIAGDWGRLQAAGGVPAELTLRAGDKTMLKNFRRIAAD